MKHLKFLIEALNTNPDQLLSSREWSDKFFDKISDKKSDWQIPRIANPSSIFSKSQNTLKILSRLGYVTEVKEMNGKRAKFKYKPLKPIVYIGDDNGDE
jgi:hypothetical protein